MARKYFECPYCKKKKERVDLIRHIEKKHPDMVPEGFTPTRIVFNYINYNDLNYNGKCVVCGGPSDWDEKKAKYNRICNNPECKKKFNNSSRNNLYRTKGVYSMCDTPEGLEKLLSNRKISGVYTFSDGVEKSYVGSYEKKALMFFDKVVEARSEDIDTPGPVLEYVFNGEKHIYISDIYYAPYNLLIEVKDGGDKPNTRNMPEYRAKQIAKEKHIIENTKYNYLRLTNNDFSQILEVLADLKMQLVDKSYDRVIHINENMFAAAQGMIPPVNLSNVYVINYKNRNTFIDDNESDIAVSDSPKFSTVFYRGKDGLLTKGDQSVLEDCDYDVYLIKGRKDIFESNIKGRVNTFIPKGFLYESVFEKKMYSHDQIRFEPLAEETIDLFNAIKEFNEMTKNYIKKDIIMAPRLIQEQDGTMKLISIDLCSGDNYITSESVPLIAKYNNLTQKYIFKVLEQGVNPHGE